MLRFPIFNFTSIVMTTLSMFALNNPAMAASIDETSINWNNQNEKSKLLETAPHWNEDAMKSLFQAYLNPAQHQLPSLAKTQEYNVQFINAFWGPVHNPFNKYPRPAKAFVIFDLTQKQSPGFPEFYMAPMAKNLTDGNYYVFDKSETHPLLLNDWVAKIKNENGVQSPLRFNLCMGYGNTPSDSCENKGFREEAYDIKSINLKSLELQSKKDSAHREINENWQDKVVGVKKLSLASANAIKDTSISWNDEAAKNALLNTVIAWPNYKVIQQNFEKIRDIRYFNDPLVSNFQRRISWLFPDDGCWTRATAVIRDLFGPFNNLNNDMPRPSKVFAFGNLCANTANSPNHLVTWWYHTAPIVRDAETNKTYVLDPSINPYKPITMEQWADEIASNSRACADSHSSFDKFNVCNGYGTGPYDQCKSSYPNETHSMLLQSSYQDYERERQVQLGRDANAVLGDLPPWLN